MEQKQPENSEKQHIHLHPAFVEALQKELEAYKDALEFYPEFPLTSEPLRIDCVVIKKKEKCGNKEKYRVNIQNMEHSGI